MPFLKNLRATAPAARPPLLAGCNTVVMNPSGDVAAQQARPDRHLDRADAADHRPGDRADAAVRLALSRSPTPRPTYEPDWDHSTQLELVIWARAAADHHRAGRAHLDQHPHARSVPPAAPHRRQARRSPPTPSRWRWRWWRSTGSGCSSIRSRASPRSTSWPRRSTCRSVQDHRLVGDELVLHSGAGRPDLRDARHGDQAARASSTSRASTKASRPTTAAPASRDMRFKFHGLSDADFDDWVAKVKAGGGALDRADYLELEKPSEREPVRRYGDGRRRACTTPSSTAASSRARCACSEMMAHRRAGRHGQARRRQRATPSARRALDGAERAHYVGAMCTVDDPRDPTLPTALRRPPTRSPMSEHTRPDQADLRPPHLGGDPATTSRSCSAPSPPWRSAASRCSARSPTSSCGATLWRDWFTSIDHKKIGIMYMVLGLVMLLRGFADALMMRAAAGDRLRRQRRLPAAAPLRPDLHRPRRDHDLLRGDAARHGPDELRRAAADRRARRGLPVPEQLQLLDDRRRRRAGHGVAVRRRVRPHRLAGLSAAVGHRCTARTSGSTTTSGRCRSPASARCCRAST